MDYETKFIIKRLLNYGYLDLYSYEETLLVIKLKKANGSFCSIENDINYILEHIHSLTAYILDGRWPKFECEQHDNFSISLITTYACTSTDIKTIINELKESWIICHNDIESELIERLEENNELTNKTIIIKKYLDGAL